MTLRSSWYVLLGGHGNSELWCSHWKSSESLPTQLGPEEAAGNTEGNETS